MLESQNDLLKDAIKKMSSRIQELEGALKGEQKSAEPSPHPLLSENTRMKENEELLKILGRDVEDNNIDEEIAEDFGSLSIGEHGQAKFFGQSAGSHVSYLTDFVIRSFRLNELRHIVIPPSTRGEWHEHWLPSSQDTP